MPRLRLADLDAWMPVELVAEVEERLATWDGDDGSARLCAHDASLWTDSGEEHLLGWLEPGAGCDTSEFAAWRRTVASVRWSAVVLLGMGGSSLGAQLLCENKGVAGRRLVVLDTTDPEEIAAVASTLDLASTLFVVASKSGSTVETLSLEEYFWAAAGGSSGGASFLAITDAATGLDTRAAERGYHRLRGVADVGGRFSVLTPFGLAVAAAMGVAIDPIVDEACVASAELRAGGSARESPGVALGVVLGALAKAGACDLTVSPPTEAPTLADWLEQLLAESTGKGGRGLLPVVGGEGYDPGGATVGWEAIDRDDAESESPHLQLRWPGGGDAALGREIYRWEVATAVAGSILSLHPFDQPDVESAKIATRAVLEKSEAAGEGHATGGGTATLGDFTTRLGEARFVAVLAFLPRSPEVRAAVMRVRNALARQTGLPATFGFGPRYLHSTGQLFKGGTPGAFLFLTRSEAADLRIPGSSVGFGVLQAAQAHGDARVLECRGRPVARIGVSGDPVAALDELASELCALSSGA